MPIPTFTKMPPEPTFQDVVAKLNRITGELQNLFLTLDSLNVVSLTADHIDTGTLLAQLVTIKGALNSGGYITIDANGMTVNNGTQNVMRIDLDGNVSIVDGSMQWSFASGASIAINESGMTVNNGTIDVMHVDTDGNISIIDGSMQWTYLSGASVFINQFGITVNNGTKDTFKVDIAGNVSAEDGVITGGTVRTDDAGKRIELSGNQFKTYNASGNLEGMVLGPSDSGFTYGDVFFYSNGSKVMEFYNTLGTGYVIRPAGDPALISLKLGWLGYYVYPRGNWDFISTNVENFSQSMVSGLESRLASIEARLTALESAP